MLYFYLTRRDGTKFININFRLLNSNILHYLNIFNTNFYYLHNIGMNLSQEAIKFPN